MEFVEPFRDEQDLENMRKCLKAKNTRDGLLFLLGINSALRISDLLSITVGQVKNASSVTVKEQKTGKTKTFPLGDKLRREIKEYLAVTNLSDDDWLFPSQKKQDGKLKPIGREYANQLIKQTAKELKIQGNYGTHSLRKSFAYHNWKRGVDVMLLMASLNHASPAHLLRYIGVTQEQLNEVYLGTDLG